MAYVYKHIRLDNDKIFYIGIGSDSDFKRANTKDGRNEYWKNVVNKHGYRVEIFQENISWEDACRIEKELILLFGRKNNGSGLLVNMTDGGDGVVGLVHTIEHRKKNSDANKGRKKSIEFIIKAKNRHTSNETKEKIRASLIGRHHSEETKQKIRDALKNKMCGENNPFYGKTHSDINKEKIRDSRSGTIMSAETKEKISRANLNKIRPHSEETKKKMSISSKKRNAVPPSRKGCCWICNETISKSITLNELDEYLLNGWVRGRKYNS